MIHLYVTQCQGREKRYLKKEMILKKKTDLLNVCKIFYNFFHQHAGITVGGSWFQGQTVERVTGGSRREVQQLSLKFMHLETLTSVLLMMFINDSLWTFKRSSSVVGRMMVPIMISPYPDPYNLSLLSNMAKQMI